MIHRLSTYDPRKHHRTSLRLQGYDYSNPGLYFITVCVYGRECLFGKIIEENMRLSELGEVAKQCWDEIPRHFHNIGLDEYQIMPNHLHGILSINVGTQHVGDVNRRDVQLNVVCALLSIPLLLSGTKSARRVESSTNGGLSVPTKISPKR